MTAVKLPVAKPRVTSVAARGATASPAPASGSAGLNGWHMADFPRLYRATFKGLPPGAPE